MKSEQNHIIFPTNSPVDVQGGEKVSAPKSLGRGLFEKTAELRDSKLLPLMKVREEANRVYSNGYFENHYRDADKTLKGMLHDKVMDAWANSLGEGAVPKKEDSSKLTFEQELEKVNNLVNPKVISLLEPEPKKETASNKLFTLSISIGLGD